MNLRTLTDSSLMQKTESYVREEREILTNLLHHFKEIDRRRLYCDYKFSSLHKMLVGHFGYSDDEAYRRVSAMRLIAELPEVETRINEGELSLSHLSLAQSFFRQEKKCQIDLSKESKLELLNQISAQPIREAQRIVLSKSSAPEELRPDKVTVVSETKTEYRFTASQALDEKLDEVKGLLAHLYPNPSLSELFEILCDLGIETLKHNKSSAASRKQSVKLHENQSAKISLAQVRREVWQEGHHQCSNCQSSCAVEVDHRFPKALGGTNSKENLRLLCRSCNQRSAIRYFGVQKMEMYLT